MNSQQTPSVKLDVYALITNRIIELLDAGTIPWRKPWTEKGIPMNAVSKRPYRGINLLLLNSIEYPTNLWLTFKQLKTIGGSVKKGEKGTFVIFTKLADKQVEKNNETVIEKKSLLRYYKVFNVEQCVDIAENFLQKENRNIEPVPECQAILANMKNTPLLVHQYNEAYYTPKNDCINLPRISSFESAESFYGTLFHELIHATGHTSRLNRKEVAENPAFGSEMYSLEELVAEMGGCYLKSYAGIPIEELPNSAAYINGWLEVFKGDRRFIMKASSRAQHAVEYILGNGYEKDDKENEVSGEVEG